MKRHTHPHMHRDGFALPMTLLAMMVIGAMVTAGFYASSQENRISQSTDMGSQALYLAEIGLAETIASLTNGDLDTMSISRSWPETPVTASGRTLGRYQVEARRIGARIYLISSTGEVDRAGATAVRRVASMVRTMDASMPRPSALSVFGGLEVTGSSEVDGNSDPLQCMGDSVAGVLANDTSLVDVAKPENVTGMPAVQEDSTVTVDTLQTFGGATLEDLKAAADLVFEDGIDFKGMNPGSTTDSAGTTVCDRSDSSNWGDPGGVGPCADYFPVVYSKGNTHLNTGKGQGILIVDGDLHLNGNMEFYGIVIVTGTLTIQGGGNHINGGAIVLNGGALVEDESTLTGNSVVQYDNCAINSAFDNSLRPQMLASRSYIDLTASSAAKLVSKFPGGGD